MKTLIFIGRFRELTHDLEEQQRLPSNSEAISESPQEDEEKIVAYLRDRVFCFGWRASYLDDVLDPFDRTLLNANPCTDGTYYWCLDIAHYVEKYHLRLPPDFIRHVASMNWQLPAEGIDVDSLEV